ncbi:MAG: polysaccharide deacetylase family protein [Clostridia bacterium]|nr:polysaccharide deacetylase family protein [Clostridia bacterium]
MTIKFNSFYKFIIVFILIFVAVIIQISPLSKENSDEKVDLPVIMYHQVTDKNSRIGKYCVSVSQLESDLKHIKENGYTTVTVNDLLSFVSEKKEIPKKPVMITFDDGFESIKEYVVKLMDEYDMKCVVSVVGSYADMTEQQNDHNVNYAYLDWDEIAQLVKDERIEIQNHSYNLHKNTSKRKGASQCAGEDFDSYRESLDSDLSKLQNKIYEISGYMPTAFTYPFGSYSKDSTDILVQLGFKAALVCAEVVNKIDTKNTSWLYKIGRFNRSGEYSTESFFEKFE